MISILGRSVVLAALLLATVGAVMSFAAAQRGAVAGVARARRLAYLYAAMMALATGLMIYALVSHDFSVSYVAQVGSLATPIHITIVSLWSSLDGSILFWGLVLGAFTAGAAFHLRTSAPDHVGYMLGTLFVVGIFFTFLIAGPADPFAPTPPPIPTDGPGPNPLLQNHPLMIIHPPMLYFGYVGMSVPFAIALAALFAGRLDRDWIRVAAHLAAGADRLPDHGRDARRLVVVRGARLGRLLGLGSGGERLVSPLAHRHRRRPFGAGAAAQGNTARPGRSSSSS